MSIYYSNSRVFLRIFSHYSRWLNAIYRSMLDTYSFEQELIFIASQVLWQKTFGFEIPSQRPSLFPSLEIFLIRILVISWHGTSIHNGHLWLPVTLWTVAEFAGAVTVRFNDFLKSVTTRVNPWYHACKVNSLPTQPSRREKWRKKR